MVVDTSAIIAVLLLEPEAESFVRLIRGADDARLSAGSWLEAAIAIDAKAGAESLPDLDAFLHGAGMVIEPVTQEQARLAREAHRRFGKGNHPAGLNFGDCFAYALAKAVGEPLLFKGEEFVRTDIEPVL